MIGHMGFLLRASFTGLALWVVTLIVPGMTFVGGGSTLQKVGIILVVAVIFGLVNAFIKPIVQVLSIPLYILTLGLFHVVINALMLLLTSWLATTLGVGWHVDGFWTALIGSIIVSVVSFVLNAFVPEKNQPRRGRA